MIEEAIREAAERAVDNGECASQHDLAHARADFVRNVQAEMLRLVQTTARRCAEIAEGYALCDDVPALHGIDIGKAAASAIRQEFNL